MPIFPAAFGAMDAGILLASVCVFTILVRRLRRRSSTPLKGPPSSNFLFGMMPRLMNAPDSGAIYEEWAAEHGSVFCRIIVLTDPKAIGQFCTNDTYAYVQTPNAKRFLERLIGRGLFWAEGDSHKSRQPAFAPASIKNLTPIFFDSAWKAKSAWDFILESSSEGAIIEVQKCLDTIGLAGFSHDFGALSGRTSAVATAFDSIGSKPSILSTAIFMLSLISPVLGKIPTGRPKSASASKISEEEVVAQINVLLWALIELCRNPDIQTKLRDELLQAGRDRDPSWEELTNNLPFLDAFTSEILRLHAPLPEIQRVAAKDDVLPLSTPIKTASGALVDTIFVSKGTMLTLPIQCMNRSVEFWGDSGHRHMLTFADGPRTCLGKGFAIAEFKAVISVLVRSYTFEFPKGPETVIGRHRNILPRPKVEGEEGYAVPLRIRHYYRNRE
ncbi:cytochrome P450 [Mycena rosella]|uniref:Cytochrome P450 n=1 Tax=Mycena rosella TaxID=1033263 RepID=A0AAD7DEH4_MYCRO|nr:cytochrome P450 [Mycena rosella]